MSYNYTLYEKSKNSYSLKRIFGQGWEKLHIGVTISTYTCTQINHSYEIRAIFYVHVHVELNKRKE